MKKRLIGSCLLTDTMRLQYYVTQRVQEDGQAVYGIEVDKLYGNDRESEEANYLSHSGKLVESLAMLLFQNKVTPMCMLQIIDERMTLHATTVQSSV